MGLEVARSVENDRWRPNGRQHVAQIRLVERAVERVRHARARPDPQPVREQRPLLVELPSVDKVGDPAWHVKQIGLARADELVGDRDAAAPSVADVESHVYESPRLAAWPQPSWNGNS